MMPTDDRIVSIAFKDAKTDEEFYEEVKPAKASHPAAEKVHGLSAAHLSTKPQWTEVGPRAWNWLLSRQKAAGSRLILVGHNAKKFDAPIFANELKRLSGLKAAKGPIFVADTLEISRAMYDKGGIKTVAASARPGKPISNRQADVYIHLFQAAPSDQHSALGDVRALIRIAREQPFRQALKTPEISLAFELGKNDTFWPKNLLYIKN